MKKYISLILSILLCVFAMWLIYRMFLLIGWAIIPIAVVLLLWIRMQLSHDTTQQYYNNLPEIMKKHKRK